MRHLKGSQTERELHQRQARTTKHADFLDLCIALTGRAPLSGVYLDENRKARRILDVEWPKGADDSIWPLLGLLAGRASPDR